MARVDDSSVTSHRSVIIGNTGVDLDEHGALRIRGALKHEMRHRGDNERNYNKTTHESTSEVEPRGPCRRHIHLCFEHPLKKREFVSNVNSAAGV